MPKAIYRPVCSSDDGSDDPSFEHAIAVWKQSGEAYACRQLAALKQEDRWQAEHDKLSEDQRARMAARQREMRAREEGGQSKADLVWHEDRALDLQDFDYLFRHREQFSAEVRTWLEFVAAKISHVREDGEDGYFRKLEQNIGWTEHITPVIFSGASITDKVVRCGLWAHAKNSRRCHNPDFCQLCLWNDVLKALVYAFGRNYGAFNRAPAWWFMTIGWTPNLLNAKYVSGDFDPQHCKRPPAGDRGYAPYPVRLGRADDDPDEAWGGHDDASILGLVMQEAIGELYQRKIVDGYHNKLEGSYRLNPGGASRTHLHCHCVGNGRETNGQFIAETLLECVHKALMKYRGRLHRKYYPDIQVKRNTSAEHLEKAIIYSEKVVPISRIVDDALSRPEAQLADGSWNPVYIEYLKSSLAQLIDDDIPNIFTGYRLDPNLPRLFRRKTAGNMTFTDRGTCIGVEPDWHAKLRRKNAKKLRDARAAKRKRQAECREAGVPVPQTKSPKRRPAPRHLRRSVGLPSRKPAAPKRLAQAVDGTRRQDSG